jgi:hypothetical protein
MRKKGRRRGVRMRHNGGHGGGMGRFLTACLQRNPSAASLYRRPLKDTLNWVVHCHLFYQEVSSLPFTATSSTRRMSDLLVARGSDLVFLFRAGFGSQGQV